MAILFGTTSEGETLPVQVNASGQLVAQGMDGSPGLQGPQGEQGPAGPKGDKGDPGDPGLQAEQGVWSPGFGNETGGSAMFFYKTRQGYWYKVGGMMTVWWLIELDQVTITAARGGLDIVGLPEPFLLNGSSAIRQGHYTVGEWGGLKPQDDKIPFIRLAGAGDRLRLFQRTVPEETPYRWVDLDEENPTFNRIGGAWTGLCASEFDLRDGVLIPKSSGPSVGLTD